MLWATSADLSQGGLLISRIVEISSPARLFCRNQQLHIIREGEVDSTVPIEDLGVLLLDNPQITMSAHLLGACADSNVAVVVCDSRHTPCSALTPFAAHSLHAKTL